MDKRQAVYAVSRDLEGLTAARNQFFETIHEFGSTSVSGLTFSTEDGYISAHYFGLKLSGRTRMVNVGDFRFIVEIAFDWTNLSGEREELCRFYTNDSGAVYESVDAKGDALGWLGSPSLCRAIANELIYCCVIGAPMRP